MTRLAGNASVEKGLRAEVIVCSDGFLYAAGMAVQAASIHFEGERHFPGGQRFRIHIPNPLLAIPIHWALKPETIFLEQIGAASLPRADEVAELLLAFKRSTGPVVAEPDATVAQEKAVVDARKRMRKLAWQQAVDCGSTGSRHRS